MEKHPFLVIRALLVINNVVCLFFYLVSMACIADRLARSDWTRFFILLAAAFGTYVTTFAVTLTNHLPATMAVAIALHQCVYIRTGANGLARFGLCGLFAAFAAANDLPATAIIGLTGFICFINSIGRTLIGFLPGVAIVVGGFFYSNYVAHDTWRPAYSFRGDGEIVARVDSNFEANQEALNSGQIPEDLNTAIGENAEDLQIEDTDGLQVFAGRWPLSKENNVSNRWVVADSDGTMRAAITVEDNENELRIRQWGNWYEYGYGANESPWLTGNTEGFDRGEPNQARYLMHILIGHHGIYLTMPVLVLALLGIPLSIFARGYSLALISLLGVAVSVVVIGFYITQPVDVRNYGGLCSAVRWLFWLIPLWLMMSIPLCDWLSRGVIGRLLCTILLAASVASSNYAILNPWVEPWPYQYDLIKNDAFDSFLHRMLPAELDPETKENADQPEQEEDGQTQDQTGEEQEGQTETDPPLEQQSADPGVGETDDDQSGNSESGDGTEGNQEGDDNSGGDGSQSGEGSGTEEEGGSNEAGGSGNDDQTEGGDGEQKDDDANKDDGSNDDNGIDT